MSILKESIKKSARKRIHELLSGKWVLRGHQQNVFDVYKSVRTYILRNNLQKEEISKGITYLDRVDSFKAGFGNPEYTTVKLQKPKTVKVEDQWGKRSIKINQQITELPASRGRFPKQFK